MRDPCFRSTPALPTKVDRPDPTGPARRPYLTSSTSSVLRLQTLDVDKVRKHVYSPLVASEAAHVRCARGPVLDSMPRGRCVESMSGCAREGVISSVRSRRWRVDVCRSSRLRGHPTGRPWAACATKIAALQPEQGARTPSVSCSRLFWSSSKSMAV